MRRSAALLAVAMAAAVVVAGEAAAVEPTPETQQKFEDMAAYLSSLPTDQLMAGFDAFDQDHDGRLTSSELVQGFPAVLPQFPMSEAEVGMLMGVVDSNEDGKMSVAEVVAALAAFAADTPQDPALSSRVSLQPDVMPVEDTQTKFQRLFKILNNLTPEQLVAGFHTKDLNHDNQVSTKELIAMLPAVLPNFSFTADEVDMLMRLIDSNDDGKMTMQEAWAGLNKSLSQAAAALASASVPADMAERAKYEKGNMWDVDGPMLRAHPMRHAVRAKHEKRDLWDRPGRQLLPERHDQEGQIAGLTAPMQHKNLQRAIATAGLFTDADDTMAGAPDSETLDFPTDVTFQAPCDDMVDPTPTATPTLAVAKPTVVDSPDCSIAREVVVTLKEMCARCGCGACARMNLTNTKALVKEVCEAVPVAQPPADLCTRYLAANPKGLKAKDEPKVAVRVAAMANQTAEAVAAPVARTPSAAKSPPVGMRAKAVAERRDQAESAAPPPADKFEYSVPVQPVVPDDCADDITGSSGVSNEEVAGSGAGMNLGFAEARETTHSAASPALLAQGPPTLKRGLIALLETASRASPCVEYEGMTLADGVVPLYDPAKVDVPAECVQACLFDDDCTAWTVFNGTSCSLFRVEHPILVKDPAVPRHTAGGGAPSSKYVSGLCPKAQLCAAGTLAQAVAAMTSAKGVEAGCPAVLKQLTTGRAPPAARCTCVAAIAGVLPKDDCWVHPSGATLAALHADCDGRHHPHGVASLVQGEDDAREPDCQKTAMFSASRGSCKTYSMDAPKSNHAFCDVDFDVDFRLVAASACWQCGKCRATPSPTPIIPPPELSTAEKLPNGDKTPCLSARQTAIRNLGTGPGLGGFVPQCFRDGTYMPSQCGTGSCWCVYTNGVEVPGSRRPDALNESMAHCRPSPPMEPVFPAPAVIKPTAKLVQARAVAKLMLSLVDPARVCRRNTTKHVEDFIADLLNMPGNFSHRNVTKKPTTDCPREGSFGRGASFLGSLLSHLSTCVLPPPPPNMPLPSASPAPSLSPSPSVSISMSASETPSPPVPMCGDVLCRSIGLRVHVNTAVPPGFCTQCLDGTSGPCRNAKTMGCYPYVNGNLCKKADTRCADVEDAHHKGVRFASDCPDYKEGDPAITVGMTLGAPYSAGWAASWGRTLSSAVADVTNITNLCSITVARATADTITLLHDVDEGAGAVEHVRVTLRITDKMFVGDRSSYSTGVAAIKVAIQTGELAKAMGRRGLHASGISGVEFRATVPEAQMAETGPKDLNVAKVVELARALKVLTPEALKSGFNKFDTNKNGKISTSELAMVVVQMVPHVKYSPGDLKAVVEMVDQDGDGEVSFSEMMAALKTVPDAPTVSSAEEAAATQQKFREMAAYLSSLPTGQLVTGFGAFDKDHDGRLTSSELMQGFPTVLPQFPMSEAEVGMLMEMVDSNADGKMSVAEVAAALVAAEPMSEQRVEAITTQKKFQAMAAYLNSLPPDQLMAAFGEFDQDHDGRLTSSELIRGFPTVLPQFPMSKDEVGMLMALVDSNGDGKMSPTEVTAALAAAAATQQKFTDLAAYLRTLPIEECNFDAFDQDQDGRLTSSELMQGLSMKLPQFAMSEFEVGMFMAMVDSNADGKISAAELLTALLATF